MSKRVFVSADWKELSNSRSCDKIVVDKIRQWGKNKSYGVEIDCTDDVHNSVMDNDNDCRRCDIKGECGKQIKWSSVVIIVIGDNTATKSSGVCDKESCSPAYSGQSKKVCRYKNKISPAEDASKGGLVGGDKMSYLEFEIKKAVALGKSVILVFNSMRNEAQWIPSWYNTLMANGKVKELDRVPFWKNAERTQDCYQDIKEHLQ